MQSMVVLKPATRDSDPRKCHQHSLILTLAHQSVSHLLPGMSHVMHLCCNTAIPGIPPWNAQIGPHRIGKPQNKTTFLRASFNKKYCVALYTVSSTWIGDVQYTVSAKETEVKYYSFSTERYKHMFLNNFKGLLLLWMHSDFCRGKKDAFFFTYKQHLSYFPHKATNLL